MKESSEVRVEKRGREKGEGRGERSEGSGVRGMREKEERLKGDREDEGRSAIPQFPIFHHIMLEVSLITLA